MDYKITMFSEEEARNEDYVVNFMLKDENSDFNNYTVKISNLEYIEEENDGSGVLDIDFTMYDESMTGIEFDKQTDEFKEKAQEHIQEVMNDILKSAIENLKEDWQEEQNEEKQEE